MKHRLVPVLATLVPLLGVVPPAHAGDPARTQIRTVLEAYEQALNASDLAGVLKLYDRDGVFMAQHNAPAVGIDAVRAAYTQVFNTIDLDIDFDILEIETLADDWAYARTTSAGTVTLNDTGARLSEGNQELFLLRRTGDGEWKIARYIFSTTRPRQPPPQD